MQHRTSLQRSSHARAVHRIRHISLAAMLATGYHISAQAQFGPFDEALQEGKQCISDAVKAGWTTAEAGAKIAQMMASPQGSLCVAQVLAPDPLMIIGAGAVLALNVQGTVKANSCENDLKTAAFKPLIGALGNVVGMSLTDDPLKGWVDQGVDYAWNTLKTAPPTNYVWSKLECGCTFVDGGVNLETVKAVAQAWTAAGKSCKGFATAMVKAVCEGNDLTQAACDTVEAGGKALNNALEGLIQDDAIPPDSYYAQHWQPWERSMAYYRYINNNNPPPNESQFSLIYWQQTVVGGMNAQSQQNKISFKALRDDTYNYYNNHKHSTSNSNKIANAMADRFWATTSAIATEALALKAFDSAAKTHQDAKKKEYAGKGLNTTVSTGKESPASLLRFYTEEAWEMWKTGAKGDVKTFGAFLNLAFNTVKPSLDAQVKQMENDKKFAGYKEYAIPKRILQADAILDKLTLPDAASVCQSPHQEIARYCRGQLDTIREEAEKLRQARLSKSFWPSDYGKQDKDGKYVNFTPKYDHAPTIVYSSNSDTGWNMAYGEQWWDNIKYTKVISDHGLLVDGFESRLKVLHQHNDKASELYEQIYPLWVTQCGAAIGEPGSPPTPLCVGLMAPAIAKCAIDLSLPKAQSGGGGGSKTPAGTGAGLSALSQPLPASAAGAAQSGKAASKAAVPPLSSLQIATCKQEAETALTAYALRHKVNPANDKPYPLTSASINDLKTTTPSSLVASLGGVGNIGFLGAGGSSRGSASRDGNPRGDTRARGDADPSSDNPRERAAAGERLDASRGDSARGNNTRETAPTQGRGSAAQESPDAPRTTNPPLFAPTAPATPNNASAPRAVGMPALPGIASPRGNESAGSGVRAPSVGLPALPSMPGASPRGIDAAPGSLPPTAAIPLPPLAAPAPTAPVAAAVPGALPPLASSPAPAPAPSADAAGARAPNAPAASPLANASLSPDQQLRAAGCTHASLARGAAMPSTPPTDGAYSCPAGAALAQCETLRGSQANLVKVCQSSAVRR